MSCCQASNDGYPVTKSTNGGPESDEYAKYMTGAFAFAKARGQPDSVRTCAASRPGFTCSRMMTRTFCGGGGACATATLAMSDSAMLAMEVVRFMEPR